jgi:hypothetical protein
VAGELPATAGGWTLTPVTSGWWVSTTASDVPLDVQALAAEPGRLSLVIDAAGPDPGTDALIDELFRLLPSAGFRAVRLVLSAAADRYAPVARAHGLDLIAAEAVVTITPNGYAVVRSASPGSAGAAGSVGAAGAAGVLPQWRRCLPGGASSAAGVLAPCPEWEQRLGAGPAGLGAEGVTVRRVPAGLALRPGDPDTGAGSIADAVWPDQERITVVVDQPDPRALEPDSRVRDGLAELLSLLPLSSTDGVRLYWPRAGAGPANSMLAELASSASTDLIVPAADVSPSGAFGGICHGPAGAAPWLRFTSNADVRVLGSVYPTPGWERGLAQADLSEPDAEVRVERIPAGLCVCRPGPASSSLTAAARSVIPDPALCTIVVGGDARSAEVKRDLENVLGRLPAVATARVRLLLAGAGSGGQDSYAQFLADTLGGTVIVPVGSWTVTPDGRLAVIAAAAGARAPAGGWQECSPRTSRRAARPQETAATVALLYRDHRSSERERLLYRESATNYQTHALAVRRMLTQRPGLRSATAGEPQAAVVTDFAAVLDFLADDQRRTAAASRAGTAGDPRTACVISGLRRLPSFTGAVFSSASLSPDAAGGYVVGLTLVEPAFVDATSSALVALEGNIEYVIWSQAGKRIAALAADAGGDEILFAAGTAYKVLRVEPSRPASGQIGALLRVLLRELAAAPGKGTGELVAEPLDEMDRRVLERLMTAAALRGEAATDDQVLGRRAGRAAPPIGIDDRGAPFLVTMAEG